MKEFLLRTTLVFVLFIAGISSIQAQTIFSYNFEGNNTDWYNFNAEIPAGSGTNTWKILNTSACNISGKSLMVCGSTGTGCTYDASVSTNKVSSSPLIIDCGGTGNLTLTFNYKCGGSLVDYGMACYSLDGTTWTNITTGGDGSGRYFSKTSTTTSSVIIPGSTTGRSFYIGFRWINGIGTNTDPGFVVDDITISGPGRTAMSYQTNTLSQASTANVSVGAVNQEVLKIQVDVTGCSNPLLAEKFNFNTSGSTNASTDILNAKVYYTGNNATFQNGGVLVGTINSPNGAFIITGSQPLQQGINYFWLSYDIKGTATKGNSIDAQCSSIELSGSAKTISPSSAPSGSRLIDPSYCTPRYGLACEAAITPTPEITNVRIANAQGNLLNNSGTCAEYTYYPAPVVPLISGFTYNFGVTVTSGGSPSNDLSTVGDSNGVFEFEVGLYDGFDSMAVFIDYNRNGSFEDAGERIFQSVYVNTVATEHRKSVTIPCVSNSFVTGLTRMRVTLIYGYNRNSPCGGRGGNNGDWGEAEDYTIDLRANTAANAGPNQRICDLSPPTSVTLNATGPISNGAGELRGPGVWKKISGPGTVTDVNNPSSTLTGLSAGKSPTDTTVLEWKIDNGACNSTIILKDTVKIIVDTVPTIATISGSNPQILCLSLPNSATLTGSNPIVGTGLWTIVSGTRSSPATFPTIINSPSTGTSTVSNLAADKITGQGDNVFRWTISNGVCPSTSANLTIHRDSIPDKADAGIDQNLCNADNSTLAATPTSTSPGFGIGTWTTLAGTGVVTTPGNESTQTAGSATSGVTNLSASTDKTTNTNKFIWTVSNGTCKSNPALVKTDTVTINRDISPITANAGPDQTICTLTGSATVTGSSLATTPDAGNGTGTWSLKTGPATIESPNPPNSTTTTVLKDMSTAGTREFYWTVKSPLEICATTKDSIQIKVDAAPTDATIGNDTIICGSNLRLKGNAPLVGTGVWKVISWPASTTKPTFTSGSTYNTFVNGLSVGTTVVQWSIGNGVCDTTFSRLMTIKVDKEATIANANVDQNVCSATATLAGNAPVGTENGIWSVVAPTSATLVANTSPTSGVNNLTVGQNKFRWAITSGVCPVTADTVIINRDALPVSTSAGNDFNVCNTDTNFLANSPTIGTGTWTLITGTGTPVSPNSPTSRVTGLTNGLNTFRWTITNGSCTGSLYEQRDDITISKDAGSTISNAGSDQNICENINSVTMSANNPTTGAGTWSVVSGSGVFTNANSPVTSVTGIAVGTNVYEWSISSISGTCLPSTDRVTVFKSPSPSASVAGSDQTICGSGSVNLNANNPSVGVGKWTVISGTAVFADPLVNNTTASGFTTGPNKLRWSIGNGTCDSTKSEITITAQAPPTASNAGTNQDVCGISATMNGNTPSVGSGKWEFVSQPVGGVAQISSSNISNTQVTDLSVGTTTLKWTITNGLLCVPSSTTVDIVRKADPTTALAGNDQSICVGNTTLAGNIAISGIGTWTVTSSPNSGAVSFNNASNPTTTVSGLVPGTHILRWTISNNPCTPSYDEVQIVVNGASTAAAGADAGICGNTSYTLNANNPSSGTGTWSVVSGSGTFSTPNLPTSQVSGLSIGANAFRWRITSGLCTPSDDEITITRSEPVSALAGPDQEICPATATLAGNTPSAGTGLWTLVSGTGTITSPTSPNSGLTGLGSGTNTFQWTITNGACTSSETVDIIRNTPSTPTATNSGPACEGGSINLSTPTISGATYSWTGPGGYTSNTQNPVLSPLTTANAGNYSVIATIGGCASVASAATVVVVNALPAAPTAANTSACSGTAATITATAPGGTYKWYSASTGGALLQTGASYTTPPLTSNTTYYVDVTSASGCLSSTRTAVTVTITPSDVTEFSYSSSTYCRNDPNPHTPTGAPGFTAGGTYTIVGTAGSGTMTINAATGAFTPNTGANNDDYTITYTTAGTCGNTYSVFIKLRNAQPTVAQVTFGYPAGPYCKSAATNPSPTAPAPTYKGTFTASPAGLVFVSANSGEIDLILSSPGSYTITNTIPATTGGCANTAVSYTNPTPVVIQAPPTTADAGTAQQVCGSSIVLTGNTPTIGTGTWTGPAGVTFTATNANSPGATANGLSNGNNILTWTISNGTCPSSVSTVTINSFTTPTANITTPAASPATVCASSTTLVGNTPPSTGTGLWTRTSGTGTIAASNSSSTNITGISPGTGGTFTWTVSNGICPSATSTPVTINRPADPSTANAGLAPAPICASTASTTLAAVAPSSGTGTWTVFSQPATAAAAFTNAALENTGVTGLSVAGNYVFRWTVGNGCPSLNTSADVTVQVDALPSTADAGSAQTICISTAGSFTLNAAAPTPGTGIWSTTAPRSITSPTNRQSFVNGLQVGSNTFTWTVSNGTCSGNLKNVVITVDDAPTQPNAGLDKTICGSTTSLLANTPVVGNGLWSAAVGISFVPTNSPTATVNGLAPGNNTLTWNISNGVCGTLSESVVITSTTNPTAADAGVGGNACSSTINLSGNVPAAGEVGTWRLITSGSTASIQSPNQYNSQVNSLSLGDNEFEWVISNGTVCPASTPSIVKYTLLNPPSKALAGRDTTFCTYSYTLKGNNLTGTETGLWTIETESNPGNSSLSNANTPGATLNFTGPNTCKLKWTITNTPCSSKEFDEVIITSTGPPSIASAGNDKPTCSPNSTLSATAPLIGTGQWTIVSAGPTTVIGSPSQPFTTVTNLQLGSNEFQWVVESGDCKSVPDNIIITRTALPIQAIAGSNVTICNNSQALSGNTPNAGNVSYWKLVDYPGYPAPTTTTIANPTAASTTVTGLNVGSTKLAYFIHNACGDSTKSIMEIIMLAQPSPSNAGAAKNVCSATTTLAANAPAVGTGTWTVVSGSGVTFVNKNDPNTVVNNLVIGNNILKWTITNGNCAATPNSNVTITRSDIPTTANAGRDTTLCTNTFKMAANVPTIGNGLWTLVSGSATIATPADPFSQITNLGSTVTNILRWTITNGSCAASFDDIGINVDKVPSNSVAGPTQNLACNNSTTLAGNTPTIGTGKWTLTGGNGIIVSDIQNNSAVNSLDPGANKFTWTISNGVCPPSASTVTINTSIPTVANAGPAQSGLCADTAILAGNNPLIGTGKWKLISGTGTFDNVNNPNTAVRGLSVGPNVFEWSITSSPCTPSTSTITINQSPSPTPAKAGADRTVCTSTINLQGNKALTGLGTWRTLTGGGTVQSINNETSQVTGLTQGINRFEWKIELVGGSCPTRFDTVEIMRDRALTVADAGTDQSLCKQTMTSITGNDPLTGLETGVWRRTIGTGTIVSPTSPTTNVTNLSVGVNEFVWEISGGVCIPTTDAVQIINYDDPSKATITGGDQTLCNTTSATINALLPSVGVGVWSRAPGTAAGINSPNNTSTGVNSLAIGSNKFIWTVSNGVCPSSFDTTEIVLLTPLVSGVASANSKVCINTVAPAIDLVGSSVGGNIQWERSIDNGTTWQNAPGSSSTFSTYSPGTLSQTSSYRAVVTNGPCLPAISNMVTMTVVNPVTSDFNVPVKVCQFEPVSIIYAGTGSLAGAFTWDFGNANVLEGSNEGPYSLSWNEPGIKAIALEVFENGCKSSPSIRNIIVHPKPEALFTTNPPMPASIPYTVPVTFTSQSINAGASILWDFGDEVISINPTETHQYTETGVYNITLMVESTEGCKDTLIAGSIGVSLVKDVYLPNSFSPNGDSFNDELNLTPIGVKSFTVQVFNRWGTLVYETSDPNSKWDGTFQGQPIEGGVYVYVINSIDDDNKPVKKQGLINIVK